MTQTIAEIPKVQGSQAGRSRANRFDLKAWQNKFLFSKRSFPAFVGPWAVGKSACAIFRCILLAKETPDNLGLICRNEFTDLRDSTIRDFELYTGLKIQEQKKEITLSNGSIIMFRHAKELNILKNVNLGFFWIEQAEELQTDEQWFFLQGRLRRQAKRLSGFITANAAGHNWIWRLWKSNPPTPDYHLIDGMTTHDMAGILPQQYLDNLKTIEIEAPAIYRRYVLNDWDEEAGVDILIPWSLIEASFILPGLPVGARILACDPARYGDCETVITILQRISVSRFAQIYIEGHQGWSTMQTAGRIVDLHREHRLETMIVDSVGIGSGVVDRLQEVAGERGEEWNVVAYNGGHEAIQSDTYVNRRAEDSYRLKQLLSRSGLRLMKHEKQTTQLSMIPYGFRSNGKRFIASKEDLKKDGLPSPDYADAVIMAASVIESLPQIEDTYQPTRGEEFWSRVRRDVTVLTQGDEKEWSEI